MRVCHGIPGCRPAVLQPLLQLALEIASERREGWRVGALFTLGRHEAVIVRSRPLILDPLFGHPPDATHISNPRVRGTIKELTRLDGAFIVSEEGTVVAACRYLDASSIGVEVPLGLGSRHVAAASISKELQIVAIAVSETGIVRLFHGGRLLTECRAAIRV
jgi:diadenylate cyclase